MRRLICMAFAMIISLTSFANSVRDVVIDVSLNRDGSADIREVWKISQDSGTEWYLVKSNLGDIRISNFSVSDENGNVFVSEGESWNTDRSLSAKAGRCGIVPKHNGCELCWGLGSYGEHEFTASYRMSNVIKSMDDYDFLHMQFVSPGLSSAPRHVKVTVRDCEGRTLSDDNSRIWGFGYEGSTAFSGGEIVAESGEAFRSNSSLILLIRFDKELYDSSSIVSGEFQEHLDKAMEGADFGDEDDLDSDDVKSIIGTMLAFLLGGILLVRAGVRSNNFKITGYKKLKDIGWNRDVPFGGDILQSNYVLSKLEATRDGNVIAAAMILRMIQNGQLSIRKDSRDKVEICFNDGADFSTVTPAMKKLYDMMKAASGSDMVLQDKEFSRWSGKHLKEVDNWVKDVQEESRKTLIDNGYMSGSGIFTDTGKPLAAGVYGFRKFLKDFTLVDERRSAEVAVWNDYLVFGALFGIASQIAKELKDIDPKALAETAYGDPTTAQQVIWMSQRLSNSITSASAAQQAKASGGHGGHASFGGGGGFSGGGFGGGAR